MLQKRVCVYIHIHFYSQLYQCSGETSLSKTAWGIVIVKCTPFCCTVQQINVMNSAGFQAHLEEVTSVESCYS